MIAYVELAMDRELPEMVTAFVDPLDAALRDCGAGSVDCCEGERPGLMLAVRLQLDRADSFERVLQFLAEANAPAGSVIYRVNQDGDHEDIMILGPEPP